MDKEREALALKLLAHIYWWLVMPFKILFFMLFKLGEAADVADDLISHPAHWLKEKRRIKLGGEEW